MLEMNRWKTVKVPPQLHVVLKTEAARNGLSLADLLETVLLDWTRRTGIKTPEPVISPERKQNDLFLVAPASPKAKPQTRKGAGQP